MISECFRLVHGVSTGVYMIKFLNMPAGYCVGCSVGRRPEYTLAHPSFVNIFYIYTIFFLFFFFKSNSLAAHFHKYGVPTHGPARVSTSKILRVQTSFTHIKHTPYLFFFLVTKNNRIRHLQLHISTFAFLLAEIVAYSHKRAESIPDLEKRLATIGRRVGDRVLELYVMQWLIHQNNT